MSRRARVPVRLLSLLSLGMGALGCPPVDNSGGFAPDGDVLTFHVVTADLGVICASREDTAVLLDDLADVEAFLADCADGAVTVADAERALDSAVLGSYGGEREFAVVSPFGGCVTTLDLFEVRLDADGGDVLRPWLLRGDRSWEVEPDCGAADAQQVLVGRAASASAADSIALTVGVYNPDLPGAPQPELYE